MIGRCVAPGDQGFEEERSEVVLARALDGADLAIDATAESRVNWLLDDFCRERRLPLVTAHATPTLAGGAVARIAREEGAGCRLCLEHAWSNKEIPLPPGADAADDVLLQPAGCADRTFSGPSYDLTEIALEAVRLAVDTLSPTPASPTGSRAHIVGFAANGGRREPPRWSAHEIRRQPACGCHPR
jgi:hypothetical protein